MRYDEAVKRASALFAASLLDPAKTPEATAATVRAMLVLAGGDMTAKTIPIAVADQVKRDVMLHFADGLTAKLRPAIERDLGAELAERVDDEVVRVIADAIIRPTGAGE
jgi:hypothetical protein